MSNCSRRDCSAVRRFSRSASQHFECIDDDVRSKTLFDCSLSCRTLRASFCSLICSAKPPRVIISGGSGPDDLVINSEASAERPLGRDRIAVATRGSRPRKAIISGNNIMCVSTCRYMVVRVVEELKIMISQVLASPEGSSKRQTTAPGPDSPRGTPSSDTSTSAATLDRLRFWRSSSSSSSGGEDDEEIHHQPPLETKKATYKVCLAAALGLAPGKSPCTLACNSEDDTRSGGSDMNYYNRTNQEHPKSPLDPAGFQLFISPANATLYEE